MIPNKPKETQRLHSHFHTPLMFQIHAILDAPAFRIDSLGQSCYNVYPARPLTKHTLGLFSYPHNEMALLSMVIITRNQ